jgi:hypothetical protein
LQKIFDATLYLLWHYLHESKPMKKILLALLFPLMISAATSKAITTSAKQTTNRTKQNEVTYFLNIKTIPPSANVRILNSELPYHNGGIRLTPGRYHIEVSHPGYQTVVKWIDLQQNALYMVDLKSGDFIEIQKIY